MSQIVFYDTNAILDGVGSDLLEKEFALSSVTLQELESIKTGNKDPTVKYKARKAVHYLQKHKDLYDVIVFNDKCQNILDEYKLPSTPDNQICACCKMYERFINPDVLFITNDLCCEAIARSVFDIKTYVMAYAQNIYKGYKVIEGTTDEINDQMSNINYSDWCVNEYLIIRNSDDSSEKEMRFNGKEFVSLRLPPSKVLKGKNSLQRCALDLLLNPEITIVSILGGYGSGKTFISLQMALYNVIEKGRHSKILGVRSPEGEGREVGYLPGTLEEKTEGFFLPLAQQLSGGEFELESLKQRGILESNIPYYMKGTTYNDTIMIVDEAEDLDEKQLRLIGTRVGNNSRIFFSGDYKQSTINATEGNALVKMCNEFKGNPLFGCIYLGEDVRSDTSKLFANLFS